MGSKRGRLVMYFTCDINDIQMDGLSAVAALHRCMAMRYDSKPREAVFIGDVDNLAALADRMADISGMDKTQEETR